MTDMGLRLGNGKRNFLGKVIALFPALFLFANQYRMFDNSSLPYIVSLIVGGGVGVLCLPWMEVQKRRVIVTVALLYLITEFFNYLVIGNESLQDIGYNILMFGLISIMFYRPHSYLQGAIICYVLLLTFVIQYLRGGNTIGLLVSSQNYVSVCLIIAVCMYYIGLDNQGRPLSLIDLLPALLCFLLSIWATGRGGILSSVALVLMLVVILVRQTASKGILARLFVVFLLVAVIFYLMIGRINLIDELFGLGKLESRGTDISDRMAIWRDYFIIATNSFGNILFGAPFEETSIVKFFGNNTHNSFIYLHGTNGLIMFVAFLVMMIHSLVYYFRTRKYVLLALTITMFLRGMTDKFIFGQYGMPIMMYLVMFPYIYPIVHTQKVLTT